MNWKFPSSFADVFSASCGHTRTKGNFIKATFEALRNSYGFITPEAGSGGDVFVHQTQIYARGFRSLAEGEEDEYEVELDESGRQRAISVTGPEGDYVQGAPRPPRADDYDAKYDETY